MRLTRKLSIGISLMAIVTLSSQLHAQAPEGCELQLTRVVEQSATQAEASRTVLLQLADPIPQFTCFIEEAGAIKSLVVPVKKKSLKEVLAAIQSQTNPGNQQQGTSVSSSATTDTVSKPSGPSAFIQNFGGISESTSGSSATYQWNPGTLISNLATGGLVPLCNSSLLVKGDCFSGTLAKILVPMTLSVTSNTSNSAQSLTATAASTSSTSSAQQVNVSSKGTIDPSFGGFSLKYVPWKFYTRQAKVPTTTKQQYIQTDAVINSLTAWFATCAAFTAWQHAFQQDLGTAFDQHAAQGSTALKAALENVVAEDYPKAFHALMKTTPASTGCYSQEEVERQLSPFLTDLLAIDAAIDLAKASSPLLGFEYDLSTPQNLTRYSTVKANFSIQFPSPKTKSGDQKNQTKDTTATYAISTSAERIKNAVNGSKSGATSDTTAPFTFTAFFGGAFYNSTPSSSISSASLLRDIQGGAEFSWLAPTSTKLPGIGSLIGNTTLAAAYYYQDQTSPAMLNGLPSTITFTGLPSDAKTVFAKRGVINLAQVRLGFGSGKNITFPLSATYSNRTELITHPTWGLQFGLNYNLSSLLTSTGGTK